MSEAILILNQEDVERKTTRLSWQIYEQNFEESEIVICGVSERGYQLAGIISEKLKTITSQKITLAKITVYKDKDQAGSSFEGEDIKDKSVILCDDVLYTGKTLSEAASFILNMGVKKLQCLVLVHRDYTLFPVHPAYIGLSLSTTLQEHVEVDFGRVDTVYLK